MNKINLAKVTELLNQSDVCLSLIDTPTFAYDEKADKIRFVYHGRKANIYIYYYGQYRVTLKGNGYHIESHLSFNITDEKIAKIIIDSFESKKAKQSETKCFKIIYTHNGNQMETEINAINSMDAVRMFILDGHSARKDVTDMEMVSITEI